MVARFSGSFVVGVMRDEFRMWREYAGKNQIRITWNCHVPQCAKSPHVTWRESQLCFDAAKTRAETEKEKFKFKKVTNVQA